tara:strand:+ start:2471 stop:2662 length:192 start_codon:yes stop_codon:yes gene_type:complete
MRKKKKSNDGWGRETFLLRLVEFDRDIFGTPKNRSKTWDIKKSRDPKQDRRKSKKDLKNDEKP